MTRKSLVKAADKAFSRYIIARDGRCLTCKPGEAPRGQLTCGHIFSRTAYSSRWNPDNAVCQCAGCNLRAEHDPYDLLELARARLGQEGYDSLHALWHQPVKFKDYQLEEMVRYWNGKADELLGKRKGAA